MMNFILAVAGAAMLSCGWLGGSGAALLPAFVPVFFLDKRVDGFWPFMRWAALTLALWSGVTTWWIAMVPGGWPGAMLSVIITTVLFGSVLGVFRAVKHPVRWVVLVAGWVAAEWLYTVGEVSFPWLTLGNGFAGDVKLVQWYEATGVFGGSVWVLICNILIFKALTWRGRFVWWAAGWIVVPIAVSLTIYYTYDEQGAERVVTVVQPNYFPSEKFGFVDPHEQADTMLVLAARAPVDVDYIVFPETALDDQLDERALNVDAFRELLRTKYPSARMIVGATTMRYYFPGERVTATARESLNGVFYDVYNTAMQIDTTMSVGMHHKSKLVIGVEKMPYAGKIRWLDKIILDLGGTTGTLGTDPVPVVFPDGIAGAICWEGVYGEYFGGFARRGATLMTIVSNDSWWGDTRGYKQLFALSRLRAVETRRAIARSANTGLSGFINQRGDVLGKTRWDERTTLTGTIKTNTRQTFHTRHGDYLARLSVLVFGACIILAIALRFRRR